MAKSTSLPDGGSVDEESILRRTTSEIAISRVLRSVHCRLHTFFLDIDLARFDSKKLCVLSKI